MRIHLVGNDIGQMRLRVGARNRVIEPAYRDDNHLLWDCGSQIDAPTKEIELMVDTVRLEQDEPAQRPDNSSEAGVAVAAGAM